MERDEIIAVAQDLCRQGAPFVLATADTDGGPRMRWMGALVMDDPLVIYMAVGTGSRKMDQIRANPLGQLLFQTQDFQKVVTLFGKCSIVDDAAARRRLWEAVPELANYMSGPDDPEFAVVRFDTDRVELLVMSEHGEAPYVAEL